jgi:hypothetical protein
MKILIPGKHAKNEWIGKCTKCGAVIEAMTPELNVTQGDYRSDNEDFAWADCIECSATHSVCFHQKGTASANHDLGR